MLIVERPVRSIGRFYAKLSAPDQAFARLLAKNAHRIPKIDLERQYLRLERAARNTTFTRTA